MYGTREKSDIACAGRTPIASPIRVPASIDAREREGEKESRALISSTCVPETAEMKRVGEEWTRNHKGADSREKQWVRDASVKK